MSPSTRPALAAILELKADPVTARIPIVALTALAMRRDEARAREAGADAFLTKPVERAALARTVADLLARTA